MIGDTRSAALVNSAGGIDFLCWPHFDGPALFLRLLDRERGGDCALDVEGPRATSRRYLPGINVLKTTFGTATGTLELLDLMPLRSLPIPPGPPHSGLDNEAAGRLLRRVRCTAGRVSLAFRIRPTFDFARVPAGPATTPPGGREARFGTGVHALAAHASHPVLPGDAPGTARVAMTLAASEEGWLALAPDRDAAAPDDAQVAR